MLLATACLANAQVVIPAGLAHPKSALDTASPGFVVRVHQANAGSGELPNLLSRTEAQLAGLLNDPATKLPYVNDADLTAFTLNPDGSFNEPVAIDYGGAGAITFPGIPGVNAAVNNIAMEALTFLDLDPGTYSMIVRSDDGFRVSVGGDARDQLTAISLGQYDGGRGASDSEFKFAITQAGGYSFRLIYEQGGGDYSVSWFAGNTNLPDARVLVNAEGGIKAYQKLTTARPAYVDYVTPSPGADKVSPGIKIATRIKDGSAATVVTNSVKFYMDNVLVTPVVSNDSNGTMVSYDPPGLLKVLTKHTVGLVFSDSASAVRSNSWTFIVSNNGNVSLPTPIYYEDFETLEEETLPAGWTVENYTTGASGEFDLDNPGSDSYLGWVTITTDRVSAIGAAGRWEGTRRLAFPESFVNDQPVTGIASNKFVYAESDTRGGSQIQYLFTRDYDLTGKTSLYVSYYSMYEQNQDSIGSAEYSIDGGTSWLPIVYMIDVPDIVLDADGKPDGVATFTKENTGTAINPIDDTLPRTYGAFIGAATNTWANLGPYISGRLDDNYIESKRVELFPIPQADNQKTVRFRFAQAGTASWYFGIDNLGIYSITTPIVVAPKVTEITLGQVLTTGKPLALAVKASGTEPFTYQWAFNGVEIAGATSSTYNLASVAAANAGKYTIVVRNDKGADQADVTVVVVSGDADLKKDLVVHLTLDGDYKDSSGKNNNATAKGSPTFEEGRLGQALHIKSTADGTVANFATLGYPSDLKFGDSVNFTIAFWVKYSSQTDDHPFISNKDWNSSGNRGWGIFSQSGNTFRPQVTGTGGTKFSTKPVYELKDGAWHNVVVSVNRTGNVDSYVDGVQLSSVPILTLGSIDTDDLGFAVNIGQDGTGKYTDGNASSLEGLVDDVGIWRRALSSDDVGALYMRGTSGLNLGTDPVSVGLVTHLAFDGDYSDASGRNNNAAASGTPDFQTGKLGKALHVKSTADGTIANFATLGYPDDLKFGDNVNFSISFWVNYLIQTDDHPFISNKDWNSSGNRGWGIFSQSSAKFRPQITGTGGTKFSTNPTFQLKDGAWHNVIVTVNRTGNVDSYVDGSLISSVPIATAGSIDTDDLGFAVNIGQDGTGKYTDGNASSLEGLVDDVGIWRRVLTSDEAAVINLRAQNGRNLAGRGVAAVVVTAPTLSGASISGGNIVLTWSGSGSFQVQKRAAFGAGNWENVGTATTAKTASDAISGTTSFYRIVAQ